MIYLYGYILVGVFVVLGALVLNRLTESADNRKIRKMIYELNFPGRDRHKLSTRILKIIVPILESFVLIFSWPYGLYWMVQIRIQESNRCSDNEKEKVFAVNITDLIKHMSIEEIEEKERINDPMGAVPDIAFGFLNPMWKKFKTQIESEDEIWAYKATWKNKWQNQKRFGYAILRGESVVHQLMTSWEELKVEYSKIE